MSKFFRVVLSPVEEQLFVPEGALGAYLIKVTSAVEEVDVGFGGEVVNGECGPDVDARGAAFFMDTREMEGARASEVDEWV